MDALSEILRSAQLSGGVFLRADFSEPWSFETRITASDCAEILGPANEIVLFHHVLEGSMRICIPDREDVGVSAGQTVVFPTNIKHTLTGTLDDIHPQELPDSMTDLPGSGQISRLRIGDGETACRVICGFLGGRDLKRNPVIRELPDVFTHDCSDSDSRDFVQSSLRYAVDEVSRGRPASDVLLAKIAEVLFTEAVRAYVESSAAFDSGWLRALNDRRLSRAIALIHRQPDAPWTNARLAREAAVSRSSLSNRFKRELGVTPGNYLMSVRMQLAQRAILSGSENLMTVAASVGYSSEAAFSRAYRRYFGWPPSSETRPNSD